MAGFPMGFIREAATEGERGVQWLRIVTTYDSLTINA